MEYETCKYGWDAEERREVPRGLAHARWLISEPIDFMFIHSSIHSHTQTAQVPQMATSLDFKALMAAERGRGSRTTGQEGEVVAFGPRETLDWELHAVACPVEGIFYIPSTLYMYMPMLRREKGHRDERKAIVDDWQRRNFHTYPF